MIILADLFCEKCDEARDGQGMFCQFCGSKLVERPLDQPTEEPAPAQPEEAERPKPKEKTPWSKSQKIGAAAISIVLVLGLGGVWAFNAIQAERERVAAEEKAEAEAEKKRLESESLTQAFTSQEINSALPNCEAVLERVDTESYDHDMQLAADLDKITNAREASKLRGTLELPDSEEFDTYVQNVAAISDEAFSVLLASSDRDDQAPARQISDWKEDWTARVLNECDAKDRYDEIVTIFEDSLEAIERFNIRADSVPWFPEGYDEILSGVAVKWVTSSSSNDCYRCTYWTADMISKNGCPAGVYAEIDILDASKRVVGWTNDTLQSLRPGEVGRLQFETYTSSAEYARFSELNCR